MHYKQILSQKSNTKKLLKIYRIVIIWSLSDYKKWKDILRFTSGLWRGWARFRNVWQCIALASKQTITNMRQKILSIGGKIDSYSQVNRHEWLLYWSVGKFTKNLYFYSISILLFIFSLSFMGQKKRKYFDFQSIKMIFHWIGSEVQTREQLFANILVINTQSLRHRLISGRSPIGTTISIAIWINHFDCRPFKCLMTWAMICQITRWSPT